MRVVFGALSVESQCAGFLQSVLCGSAEQSLRLGRGWRLLRWLWLITFSVTSIADGAFLFRWESDSLRGGTVV